MMLMGGGIALALGSFLAWGTVLGISVSGMDGGDGWMTLLGGAAVAVAGFAAYSGSFEVPGWLAWAGLVVGLGVALINFFDIMGTDGVSVGIGMWLMLLGGAVAIFGKLQLKKA